MKEIHLKKGVLYLDMRGLLNKTVKSVKFNLISEEDTGHDGFWIDRYVFKNNPLDYKFVITKYGCGSDSRFTGTFISNTVSYDVFSQIKPRWVKHHLKKFNRFLRRIRKGVSG